MGFPLEDRVRCPNCGIVCANERKLRMHKCKKATGEAKDIGDALSASDDSGEPSAQEYRDNLPGMTLIDEYEDD